MIVEHVLHAISSVCYMLLRKNGTLMCEVAGNSADLAQGGLEIPCRLHFTD